MSRLLVFLLGQAVTSTIVIEPLESPALASVIFLHGKGVSAEQTLGWARSMRDSLPHIRWVLPSAPEKAWYSVEVSANGLDECSGIEESTRLISNLIEKEVAKGVPHSRIFLVGYSQGGALSLWTGLQYKHALGGIGVIAGYLPKRHRFVESSAGKSVPVHHCHGEADRVVPLVFAQSRRNSIVKNGHAARYTLVSFPGLSHDNVNKQILNSVSQWLIDFFCFKSLRVVCIFTGK